MSQPNHQRYYEQAIALPAELGEVISPKTVEQELAGLSPKAKQYVYELELERETYHREARTDLLTELPNRRALAEWVEPIIESIQRQRQHREHRSENPPGLTLAVIDIDHFKAVNDQAGHKAGDVILKWLAHFLSDQVRAGDMVARIGGEEFVIGYAGSGSAITERINGLHQGLVEASADQLVTWGVSDREALTVSIGLAEFDQTCETYDDLFLKADAALYSAKVQRNQVVAYNPNDPDMASKVRGG
ncbi:MAG TPA: GGDEF domain-containing protein [Candidatus Saccharimonadales bacterium]|nr:GGDEF domain-containing protein [Candidatus Saccharimonadales bacterium]